MIVVGIAGVVAMLLPVLAMYRSCRSTIAADGRADRAIVLSRSQTTEYDSSLSRESVAIIYNARGVRHDARGEPLVSTEVVLPAPVSRRRDHSDVNVTLRGSDRIISRYVPSSRSSLAACIALGLKNSWWALRP